MLIFLSSINEIQEMMERDKDVIICVNDDNPITMFEFLTNLNYIEILGYENLLKVRELEVGETFISSEVGIIERLR